MNNEKETGGATPKGKRGLLIGVLIGLVILLVLAVVVFATPLKDVFLEKKSEPEVSLELIGEQWEEEGKYRFEIEALVTGNPLPEVTFSRDDSAGEAGKNRARILLAPGEQYNLTAAAENSAGRATASLELEAPGEPGESREPEDSNHTPGSSPPAEPGASQKPGASQEPGASQKPGTSQEPGAAQKPDPAEGEKPPESGAPKENNPPVIKEIEIDKNIVFTGINCLITAVASDPDGDPLSYEWSGDGSIAGAKANPMTWTAPAQKGDYTIQVTVKDGRGGTATMSKKITVNDPISLPPMVKPKPGSTTLTHLGRESGWIIDGNEVMWPVNTIVIGDNHLNAPSRGLVSFDLSSLAGKKVKKAVLTLTEPTPMGNPSVLGKLLIGTARWGARPIEPTDYNLPGASLGGFSSYDIVLSSEPDGTNKSLVNELQKCIDLGLNRFQIRLQFEKKTDYNAKLDGVEYILSKISLSVDYD